MPAKNTKPARIIVMVRGMDPGVWKQARAAATAAGQTMAAWLTALIRRAS